MTDEEQAGLENLRNETDDVKHHDRFFGFLIAFAVVAALVVFIGLGYLAVSTHTVGRNIQTLLTNGKTTSAIAAKKTAGLAEQIKAQNVQIKNLLITDHAQNVANQQHQNAVSAVRTQELAEIQALVNDEAAGVKETPALLKQVEDAIAVQDAKAISTAVNAAVAAVEKSFAPKGKP